MTGPTSLPTPDGNITLVHIIHPQNATGTDFGGVTYQVNLNPALFGLIPEGEHSPGHTNHENRSQHL
jgi:hypothetical protein